jgi:hypothetical protein
MKTMTEAEVMKIFNGYKKQLIKQLGKEVTTNEQLDRVAYKLLGSKYKGTYSVDNVPLNKNGLYIVNTDLSTSGGVHWVALKVTGKTVYVFDSFGRKSTSLLKLLVKNAKIFNKKVIDSDYDVDQKVSSAICGPLSLSWLLTVSQLGIKNSLKI